MQRKPSLLRILLIIVTLFLMISSILFIAIEADHDCKGEDCPICYQIAVCEKTYKFICSATFFLTIVEIIYNLVIEFQCFIKEQKHNISLITLKTKLSN